MKKLFVIIRQDIEPGLQAAQACHAVQAMNDQHPDVIRSWDGNIVLLGVSGMKELSELQCRLQRLRVPLASFCEPDLGGEPTSLAVHGDAWRYLSSLPLALRRQASLQTVAA
jgi:hypothetical protein